LFKADHYTLNCVQPHPWRFLIATSGIDNVIRFWEPATTALKRLAERDFPDEIEDRDKTSNIYDVIKQNRKQVPENIWENLFNTMGIEIPSNDLGEPNAEVSEERAADDSEDSYPVTIRCRNM